jgi:signal peptidase II
MTQLKWQPRSSLWLALAGLIFYLDQLSKSFIINNIELGSGIKITGWLNIIHVQNTGIAFGWFANTGLIIFWLLVVTAILASLFLVLYLTFIQQAQQSLQLAASFALGGAIGNIFDKLAYGYVIDFIDLHWQHWHWPQFNLADSFIVIAAFIYLSCTNSAKANVAS